jgi:hypothetical protein
MGKNEFLTLENIEGQTRQRSFLVACLHLAPGFKHGANDLTKSCDRPVRSSPFARR